MKNEQFTLLDRPGHQFEHPPGGIRSDDEQSVIGVNHSEGMLDRVANRGPIDTVPASGPCNFHLSFVPH